MAHWEEISKNETLRASGVGKTWDGDHEPVSAAGTPAASQANMSNDIE